MRDVKQVVARGTALGLAPEVGARRTPLTPIRLDRPLDLRPELGQRLDFATVAHVVRDAAGSLRELGVRPGQRVVVLKRNHIDIHLLAGAIARLGAIPVLLSPALDAVSLAQLFERLGAAALVSDVLTWTRGNVAEVARETLPATVALVDGDAEGACAWPPAPSVPPPLIAPRDLDEPALITHTSGTTGVPKLVVQSVRSFAEVTWLSAGRPRLLRLRETVAAHLLFAHVRANTGMSAIFLSGWPLLAIADHNVDRVGALFEEIRPGIVETHPNTFVLWERLADDPSAPLSNVACFHSTFDAVHPRTIERLLRASQRRQPIYLQAYGQSESGPVTMRLHTRWSAQAADGRCVGYAHARYSRFRIRDGQRAPGGAHAEGLIETRTRGRSATYLGQGEQYDAKLDDGWWNMEDVGYRSRWGCLHLVDREIEQTTGVESLLGVEDVVLGRLPQLTEVVLIPTTDGSATPIVCTRDDARFDRDAWRAATRDLPGLGDPLHLAWDGVPRTGTWKVRRLHVRELIDRGDLRPL